MWMTETMDLTTTMMQLGYVTIVTKRHIRVKCRDTAAD